jgi:hypothetical protein
MGITPAPGRIGSGRYRSIPTIPRRGRALKYYGKRKIVVKTRRRCTNFQRIAALFDRIYTKFTDNLYTNTEFSNLKISLKQIVRDFEFLAAVIKFCIKKYVCINAGITVIISSRFRCLKSSTWYIFPSQATGRPVKSKQGFRMPGTKFA